MSQRYLSERLKTFLDEKTSPVIVNPLVCFLESAHACVGVEEVGGDNRGPLVEAFQATIGGVEGESWCLSFIQALTSYTEHRFNVNSNLPLTEHVLTLWDRTHKDYKFDPKTHEPQAGDIVVWRYGKTMKGHAGIVIKYDASCPRVFNTIEGNTGPSGIVEREGDGVYKKVRAKSGTSLMQVVGFIRPIFI
jgi:hypothetical protein